MSTFYADPTPDMLEDIVWNAIWEAIRGWDLSVPEEYSGYSGATGNHVTAIYRNVMNELYKHSKPATIKITEEGDECPLCHQKLYKLAGILACACIELDEDGNIF
jgi:hypothetical protein